MGVIKEHTQKELFSFYEKYYETWKEICILFDCKLTFIEYSEQQEKINRL